MDRIELHIFRGHVSTTRRFLLLHVISEQVHKFSSTWMVPSVNTTSLSRSWLRNTEFRSKAYTNQIRWIHRNALYPCHLKLHFSSCCIRLADQVPCNCLDAMPTHALLHSRELERECPLLVHPQSVGRFLNCVAHFRALKISNAKDKNHVLMEFTLFYFSYIPKLTTRVFEQPREMPNLPLNPFVVISFK